MLRFDVKMPCVAAVITLLALAPYACAIKCYQCASSDEPDGVDTCGAYAAFDSSQHVAVDCISADAFTPGTFCVKETHQGPRGFLWEKRWRQVIRRCATISQLGITEACFWEIQMNGEYVERCFCSSEDPEVACNSAPPSFSSLRYSALAAVVAYMLAQLLM